MSRIVRALRHNGRSSSSGEGGAKPDEYHSAASSETMWSSVGHGEEIATSAAGSGDQMMWEEAVDPHFNRVYYHNNIDKRSTWSRPDLNQAAKQIQSQGLDRHHPQQQLQQQQYQPQHHQQPQQQLQQQQHQPHQQPQPTGGAGNGGDDQVWLEAFDPTFSRPYYFETQNKRSTWTRPQLEQVDQLRSFLDTHHPQQQQQQQRYQQQPMQTLQEHSIQSPTNTEVSTSPFQHPNSGTTHGRTQRRESRRNRQHKKSSSPTMEYGRQTIRVEQKEQEEWIRHWDDTHQRKYYYCPVTKQSSWKKPKGLNVVIKKGDSRRGRAQSSSSHTGTRINSNSNSNSNSRVKQQRSNGQHDVTAPLFAQGSTVEVFGLRSSDSLNGMYGIVLNSLMARNRTVVKIGGKKLSLRNANLRAVSPADASQPSSQEKEEEVVDKDSRAPSHPTKKEPSARSSATNNKAKTAAAPPVAFDPSIAKFVKLLRRGISRTAIEFQMKQAGIDPSLLPPGSNDDSSASAAIVLAPPPSAPAAPAAPKEASENFVQMPSRHVAARSSDAVMSFSSRNGTEPNPEPSNKTTKGRQALQMNLSQQLGSIKLRKTKSEGGENLHERLAGDSSGGGKSKSGGGGGGMSWLASLRTNPKFNAIRRASLSVKAEEEKRERAESLTHAFE